MIDYVKRRPTATATATGTPPPPPSPTLVMCPACGADVPPVGPVCTCCGERSLSLPAHLMWAVGGVHQVRRTLRTRLALCIDADPSSLTLLLPDGSTTAVEPSHPVVEPPLPREHFAGLRTSPGLLLRFARGAERNGVPWSGDTVTRAALDHAGRDRVLARLVALDALTLGRPDLLPHLCLAPSETRWIALVDAARRHDGDAVLDHAPALPHGRYRRSTSVLAAVLPLLRSRPDAGPRLATLLRGNPDPLAAVVARALGGEPASEQTRWQDSALRARLLEDGPERDQMLSLLDPEHSRPCAPINLGRAAERLFLRLHPAAAASVGLLPGQDLPSLAVDELDDLLDAGVVGREDARGLANGAARSHLLARLAPEDLGVDELDAHPEERGRRELLGGRIPAPEAGWATLVALRAGRWEDVEIDDVPTGDRAPVRLLLDAGTRPGGLLDADVLADRTLWPAIAARLGGDRAALGGKPYRRAPEFCSWLDLYDGRRHLEKGDLDRADAKAGRATDAPTPTLRQEAHALRAAIRHARGDTEGALAALDLAQAEGPSDALLANLAVVARALPPQQAAERLLRASRDLPPTQQSAVTMTVLRLWRTDDSYWQGDDEDRVLPPILQQPLRDAAEQPLSLEDFHVLLRVLASKDAAWLVAHGLERSPHRDSVEARFGLAYAAGHQELLAFFASIASWNEAPPWLESELDAWAQVLRSEVPHRIGTTEDPPDADVDFFWALATRVHLLGGRTRQFFGYLAIALVCGRAVNRQRGTPAGALAHWKLMKTADPIGTNDQGLVAVEELASRRLAILEGMALRRRAEKAVDDYNEWLEKIKRSVYNHNKAMDVFQHSVDELQEVRSELSTWSGVSTDPNFRELFAMHREYISGAIPHIQRMIIPKLQGF